MGKTGKMLLFAAIIMLIMSLPLFAAEGDSRITVCKNAVFEILADNTDRVLSDFDTLSDGFSLGSGADEISLVSTFSGLPYKPFDGKLCYNIHSVNESISSWRYIQKEYEFPIDLGDYKYLFYAIDIPYITEGTYKTSISIYSGNEKYSAEAEISSDAWNVVVFDLSGCGFLNNVERILIGAVHESIYTGSYKASYDFRVDYLGVSAENPLLSLKYLDREYTASGGTLDITAERMHFAVNDYSPFIKAATFNMKLKETNCLKMRFMPSMVVSTVTLYYKDSPEGQYSDKKSSAVKLTGTAGTVCDCYFPVSGDEIYEPNFVFGGELSGEIEIYSISPVSYSAPESDVIGQVDSCVIANNRKEIMITGTLTNEAASRLAGKNISLFEYSSYKGEERQNLIYKHPVSVTPVGERFAFKLPLENNGTSRINSVFSVAVIDGISIELVDMVIYIQNPQLISQTSWKYPEITNKKGMQTFDTEAQILGVKNTALTVSLCSLITLETDGSITYAASDGKSYYFDAAYVEKLDDEMRTLFNAGINVTFALVAATGVDSKVNSIITHPNASRNAAGYAINTRSGEGAAYFISALEFLTKRYASDSAEGGRVLNFVIGNCVNLAYLNYNMGGADLGSFCEDYAHTLRIANNTIRSICSSVKIFVSLDCRWDTGMNVSEHNYYDGRAFLDALNAKIKADGDFPWGVSLNPYPQESYIFSSWKDSASEPGFETPRITMRNIEYLCKYLSREPFQWNGETRRIMLLESGYFYLAGGDDLITQTADYIYSYYKINTEACAAVDCLITNRQNNYNDVYKYIDTDKSFDVTEFAKELIGIAEWSEIIDGFSEENVIKRSLQTADRNDLVPDGVTGSMVLFSFGSKKTDTAGFTASDNCASVSGGGNLTVVLKKTSRNEEYRGIANTFGYAADFSNSPYMTFDITVLGLPSGVSQLEVTLLFFSGDSYFESVGRIYKNKTNTVCVDLGGFSGISSVDRMKLWIRGVDGKASIGEPTVVIGNISVLSKSSTDAEIKEAFTAAKSKSVSSGTQGQLNMPLVWTLIGVIIVMSSLGIINIMSRMRETK